MHIKHVLRHTSWDIYVKDYYHVVLWPFIPLAKARMGEEVEDKMTRCEDVVCHFTLPSKLNQP